MWCHCYDRPLKYGKSKCFDTHTDTVETLPRLDRLFQHVVSGWKATQKRCGSTRPGQNVSLIRINTMTLSGRIRDTFKTAWKVYHNSSDHNGSVFHWGVVGDLRVHNIYKSRVLVPVPNLQKRKKEVSDGFQHTHKNKREHVEGTNNTRDRSDADLLNNAAFPRGLLPLPWGSTKIATNEQSSHVDWTNKCVPL